MPSGITSDIYEGKDVSLRDYLMKVGRQMSLAIHQRDEDSSAPIRLRKPYTAYSDEQETKGLQRIKELDDMSLVEAAEAARAEYKKAQLAYKNELATRQTLLKRYTDMRKQVEAWEPHPKVAYVKEHALKFIDESIDFDCHGTTEEEMMKYYPHPEKKSAVRWLKESYKSAERSIKYARESRTEELNRVANFNQHIEAFLGSLPSE